MGVVQVQFRKTQGDYEFMKTALIADDKMLERAGENRITEIPLVIGGRRFEITQTIRVSGLKGEPTPDDGVSAPQSLPR